MAFHEVQVNRGKQGEENKKQELESEKWKVKSTEL
jgi:hypothetical protein